MRQIDEIIIHCSATEEGQDYTIADIDRWHRKRGFKMVGYHFVIGRDGLIEQGRPPEMVGAHCRGHNSRSIGICYIGGLRNGRPADTRTELQKEALKALVDELKLDYRNARIHGHNEFAAKDCPCFDVNELR